MKIGLILGGGDKCALRIKVYVIIFSSITELRT